MTFLTAAGVAGRTAGAGTEVGGTIAAMRLLDADVDLVLLALTVLLTVWAVRPQPQPPADVPLICIETVCYPAPVASP